MSFMGMSEILKNGMSSAHFTSRRHLRNTLLQSAISGTMGVPSKTKGFVRDSEGELLEIHVKGRGPLCTSQGTADDLVIKYNVFARFYKGLGDIIRFWLLL